MARRKRVPKARFEDMPERLGFKSGQSKDIVDERHRWLEEHGLTVVGYLGWASAQRPRPPSRRTGPLPDDLQALVEEGRRG